MVRTEETEVLRLRIAALKDKIALKEVGGFDFGVTLNQLKAALVNAENELAKVTHDLNDTKSQENFELSE